MLEAGWEVPVSNTVDLFAAVRAGDAASVARMVELDPALLQARNEQGVSAVLMACYMGRKEIRDLLIQKGAILQLHEAAAAGNLSRVKELVEGKPDLAKSYSPDGFPVMALAAAFGHEEVARYLHGVGADVNAVATNVTGYTSLTGALASSHSALAKWLAEKGAGVDYRDAKGHSPVLEVSPNGKLRNVGMLDSRGAHVQMGNQCAQDAVQLGLD